MTILALVVVFRRMAVAGCANTVASTLNRQRFTWTETSVQRLYHCDRDDSRDRPVFGQDFGRLQHRCTRADDRHAHSNSTTPTKANTAANKSKTRCKRIMDAGYLEYRRAHEKVHSS